jgi:aspartyl-tRNA(Asn)/glutamyl-tRNA(Gln) amidotransferase subunit C
MLILRSPGLAHPPCVIASFTMSGDLSQADVERLARLARLALTSDEKRRLARQLTVILAYADQVQAVDTSSVSLEPEPAPGLVLRDDRVMPSLDRGEVLSSAPAADLEAGLFKVPRVIG